MIEKRSNVIRTAILQYKKNIILSKTAKIGHFCFITTPKGLVKIGDRTQINASCSITGGVGVRIGHSTMIAPNCVIASGTHNYRQVTQLMIDAGSYNKGPIIIGNDVWIGANCSIIDGANIGDGCVVAANTTVNTAFPPYSVIGGNPAMILFNRFEKFSQSMHGKTTVKSNEN